MGGASVNHHPILHREGGRGGGGGGSGEREGGGGRVEPLIKLQPSGVTRHVGKMLMGQEPL